jgi:hypothetical protein
MAKFVMRTELDVNELKEVDEFKSLIPYNNQYDELKKSVKENGFLFPIIVNKNKEVIDGYTRLRVARELGISKIPVEVYETSGREEELEMILNLNIRRRQLTKDEIIMLIDKIHEMKKKFRSNPMNRQIIETDDYIIVGDKKIPKLTNIFPNISPKPEVGRQMYLFEFGKPGSSNNSTSDDQNCIRGDSISTTSTEQNSNLTIPTERNSDAPGTIPLAQDETNCIRGDSNSLIQDDKNCITPDSISTTSAETNSISVPPPGSEISKSPSIRQESREIKEELEKLLPDIDVNEQTVEKYLRVKSEAPWLINYIGDEKKGKIGIVKAYEIYRLLKKKNLLDLDKRLPEDELTVLVTDKYGRKVLERDDLLRKVLDKEMTVSDAINEIKGSERGSGTVRKNGFDKIVDDLINKGYAELPFVILLTEINGKCYVINEEALSELDKREELSEFLLKNGIMVKTDNGNGYKIKNEMLKGCSGRNKLYYL